MELTGIPKFKHKAKGCLNLISLTCSMLVLTVKKESISIRISEIKKKAYEIDDLLKELTSN